MIETEVKILEINKRDITAQLIKLGAKKVFSGNVFSILYDVHDKTLRLRNMGGVITLTCKTKAKGEKKYKVRNEKEVKVSNFTQMKKVLAALGYRIRSTQAKYRTSFETKNAHFDMDEIKGIPVYMEIEAEPRIIDNFVSRLGFDKSKVKPWNTDELIRHYSKGRRKSKYIK